MFKKIDLTFFSTLLIIGALQGADESANTSRSSSSVSDETPYSTPCGAPPPSVPDPKEITATPSAGLPRPTPTHEPIPTSPQSASPSSDIHPAGVPFMTSGNTLYPDQATSQPPITTTNAAIDHKTGMPQSNKPVEIIYHGRKKIISSNGAHISTTSDQSDLNPTQSALVNPAPQSASRDNSTDSNTQPTHINNFDGTPPFLTFFAPYSSAIYKSGSLNKITSLLVFFTPYSREINPNPVASFLDTTNNFCTGVKDTVESGFQTGHNVVTSTYTTYAQPAYTRLANRCNQLQQQIDPKYAYAAVGAATLTGIGWGIKNNSIRFKTVRPYIPYGLGISLVAGMHYAGPKIIDTWIPKENPGVAHSEDYVEPNQRWQSRLKLAEIIVATGFVVYGMGHLGYHYGHPILRRIGLSPKLPTTPSKLAITATN